MLTLKKTPEGARELNSAAERAPQRGLKKIIRGQLILVLSTLLLLAALIFPMSVAWFTNVAQTGGMQFQAEAWGFDAGKITVSEPVAVMLPGDTGFVGLSVDNSGGKSAVRAAVQVNKSGLDAEMQRRVFFYVDEPRTVSFGEGEAAYTETVTRQYVAGSSYDYVYQIPRGECLTLAESYYSDAPLKWEWVYDMEGYYFIGSISQSGETQSSAVQIDTYLRPIEYRLEDAVFENGQLASIDGVPLAQFLKNVFDTDGFAGTLALTDSGEIHESAIRSVDGEPYYPVEVDETGCGVWAYLCSESEIQAAGRYDAEVGTVGVLPQTVTITVTVSNVEGDEIRVDSIQALTDRLRQVGGGETLTLSGDLTADAPIGIQENADVVLDLNGYAIFVNGVETDAFFTVPVGAHLTLLGGEVRGAGGTDGSSMTNSSAVLSRGGEVTLSGVKVTGFDTAVYVEDRETQADSVVRITNCDLTTEATAVFINGNGAETPADSRIIIQNSTIRSGYIGISGQGSDGRWGTELVVLDSTVEGHWAGIYQPQQQSTAVISGCSVSGYTGLVVKGGTATLYASTVTGTGEHQPAAAGSGFTDTGGGVYVEATYPWGASVILRGSENKIESMHGHALELFGNSGMGPGRLLAEGGAFSSGDGKADWNWNHIGTFSVPAVSGQQGLSEE